MQLWQKFVDLTGGQPTISAWIALFLLSGFGLTIWQGFFRARKIQPKGFKWKTFRNEGVFAVINLATAGVLLGAATGYFTDIGLIALRSRPIEWWIVALEYALYFFAFNTWFYWWHRAMHVEPFYKYVHKIHPYSISPNLLTTLSVSPFESIINGGFVPLFLLTMTFAAFPVHEASMALIGPTNVVMGLYVHTGYEFSPRCWNKNWATKWFITATFHDHHRYFRYNFGGHTTIWDYICGTVRPKFD